KEIAESMDIKILRADDVSNLIKHVKSVYEKDIETKGESSIEFLKEENKTTKKKQKSSSVKDSGENSDSDLVKRFKTLRLKLSKTHKMYPLYTVYTNAMIDDIIRINPKTKEALNDIKGF